MNQVKVNIEKAECGYSAYMTEKADILGYSVIGEGRTVHEAIEDFNDSYREIREYCMSHGEAFKEANFTFYYDTASFIQYFAGIFSLSGLERITGINQKQLGHYLSGFRRPSPKTAEKVEKSVRRFTEELSAIHFV